MIAPDSGIFGASFTAMAGVTKNLYEAAALDLIADPANAAGTTVNTKAGYDAADNDADGYVDDIDEITVTPAPSKTFASYVAARLARHTHASARSETLYGILVEGQGPLGSVFNRDDFTSREVGDTDGDGMLEFIDAWGQPLQFYRWPIYHGGYTNLQPTGSSDSQKAWFAYVSTEPRQQDPLDPNQLLVAPAWWAGTAQINSGLPSMSLATPGVLPDFSVNLKVNGPLGTPIFGAGGASQQANAIMAYFHLLVDPGAGTWDRTGSSVRRAYYSRPLVVSGGPDKVPGTFQLGYDYSAHDPSVMSASSSTFLKTTFPDPSLSLVGNVMLLNWCESQAASLELGPIASQTNSRTGTFLQNVTAVTSTPLSQFIQGAGLDDISNHTLSAPGAGAK